MPGLISICFLLSCLAMQGQAQIACTVDLNSLDTIEPDIQKFEGRWYESRWGAYASTQMKPFPDFMLNVAKSEPGVNTTTLHAGIRMAAEDDQCASGPGSLSILNQTARTSRLFVQIDNSSITFDLAFRLMEFDYDSHMLMIICSSGQSADECEAENVEFWLWSRSTNPDKFLIERLEEKMKLYCISQSWIFKNNMNSCDALSQAGNANCPVNLDLVKYDNKVNFTKVAGKWYQINYGSNLTTYMPSWSDFMMEYSPNGAVMDLTANIRVNATDEQCLSLTGTMAAVEGHESVFTATLANTTAKFSLTYVSRILEIDYDAYKVVGICEKLTSGLCNPNTTEITVWSRKKFLSSEHLKKVSRWYDLMCIQDHWIAISDQQPCGEKEPVQAANAQLPHMPLLITLIIASFLFGARSSD